MYRPHSAIASLLNDTIHRFKLKQTVIKDFKWPKELGFSPN